MHNTTICHCKNYYDDGNNKTHMPNVQTVLYLYDPFTPYSLLIYHCPLSKRDRLFYLLSCEKLKT